VKGNDNIVISRAKGKSNRRFVRCQEDEEELVLVLGVAEDALFEGLGGAPDEGELLWAGPLF
jgi:hypothetical protein